MRLIASAIGTALLTRTMPLSVSTRASIGAADAQRAISNRNVVNFATRNSLWRGIGVSFRGAWISFGAGSPPPPEKRKYRLLLRPKTRPYCGGGKGRAPDL